MKKAFTLAEMLVCITIMGAVAMLMFANMDKNPNNSMIMFRKAYNTTSEITYKIMQDINYYATETLQDTAIVSDDGAIEGGERPVGATKYCQLFANYLNTVGDVKCDTDTTTPSFVTADGINWYLPPKSGSNGNWRNSVTIGGITTADAEKLWIDVNGTALPNCLDGAAGCVSPDRFEIVIVENGKLIITGKAQEYMITNSKVMK